MLSDKTCAVLTAFATVVFAIVVVYDIVQYGFEWYHSLCLLFVAFCATLSVVYLKSSKEG